MVTHVHRLIGLRCVAALLAVALAPAGAGAQQDAVQCTPDGSLTQLPDLSEASGLASSVRTPGRFWTHNDSGDPVVVALDDRGTVVGRVRVSGANVEDWEAVTTGPCDKGSCIYIGDIGDNDAGRRRITVYQVPEPAAASGTATVSAVFHASYPDGAHDAETLFVAGGRLYVVTKGETGPVAVYGFPEKLQSGSTMTLERIGQIASKADADSRITDGAASADGRWIVLRSKTSLTFYRAADLLGGQAKAASTVKISTLKEPQGEGVAFGPDNTIFVAGEAGKKRQPGTFGRLSCALPKV